MKYKIGDEVIIKNDLKVDHIYNNCMFREQMIKYKGKRTKILKETNRNSNIYHINIDRGSWCWSSKMLIKLIHKAPEDSSIMDLL